MKNQNDLIIIVVAIVCFIGWACICLFVLMRTPAAPQAPAVVATADAPLPPEAPVMAASLPQPKGGQGAGGAFPSFGSSSGGRSGPVMGGMSSSGAPRGPVMSKSGGGGG